MYFFYDREGRRAWVGFETKAAIHAGNKVRAEIRGPVPLSGRR